MGVDVEIHILLTWALVGDEWSASLPGCLNPGTHSIGDWAGPRAGLEYVKKRKFSTLPGLELVVSRYTDYDSQTPKTHGTQNEEHEGIRK
jgi:hypothetical protein